MYFFINPGKRGAIRRRAAKKKRATLDRRKRRRHTSRKAQPNRSARVSVRGSDTSRGIPMARRVRRRRRRATVKHQSLRRRVRRRRRVFAANPPRRRRRRRVHAFARNPRRRRRLASSHHRRRVSRRYRRNPPLGNIVGQLKQGVMDGLVVVGGQVAARKIRGAVTGMLPDSAKTQVASGAGHIALTVASALAVSVAARKFLPNQARMLTAGAFSEAINAALSQTPVAPYLGAFAPRRISVAPVGVRPGQRVPAASRSAGVRAWPQAIPARVGVNAWPTMRSVGMPVGVGA